MPIYEFKCNQCKKIFEILVLSPREEKDLYCPKCKTKNLQKLMSTFAGGKTNCSSCTATSCSPTCSSGCCH